MFMKYLQIYFTLRNWAVMYLCINGINFVSFYDFDILFWNCSDSVIYFVFHFIDKYMSLRIVKPSSVYKSFQYPWQQLKKNRKMKSNDKKEN